LELRLFGSIGLKDGAGTNVSAVLRQPMRLALLAVCVVEGRSGFVTRDRLLELFWPEAPARPAQLRLRQALHYVRSHVGDALESIPKLGVRIRTDKLRSDVTDFDRALEEDRPADALSIYGGPFMDAVHIDSDGVALERWIDETRTAYRRLAVEAAFRAADRARESSRYDDAAACLEHAARLDPTDEAVAGRIIRALDRFGDAAAAIRAYTSFASRFRAELDLDPSPGLQSLSERLTAAMPRYTLPETDSVEIQRLDEFWFECAARADWDGALTIATTDAMVCPPGEPVRRGIPSIREWYESRPPAKHMDHCLTSIVGVRDMAWTHGSFTVTVDDGTGGQLTMNATYSSGFVRIPDGSWRVFFGSWHPVDRGPIV
jgi:DNA-binding SARP family transcriptional activator/ketosteroid isomerase-like protein